MQTDWPIDPNRRRLLNEPTFGGHSAADFIQHVGRLVGDWRDPSTRWVRLRLDEDPMRIYEMDSDFGTVLKGLPKGQVFMGRVGDVDYVRCEGLDGHEWVIVCVSVGHSEGN